MSKRSNIEEGCSTATKPKSLSVIVTNEGLVVNGTSPSAKENPWNRKNQSAGLLSTQEVIRIARQRERKLLLAVICLCILSFALFAIIFVSGPLSCFITGWPPRQEEALGFSGICDSIQCVDIAYNTLRSANFIADPCEDFHHFACSKWQAENPIVDEQLYSAANINQIRDTVDKRLKNLLENSGFHEQRKEFAAPQAFYESCLNFTEPDETFMILDLIGSSGGYKTKQSWSEDEFSLTSVVEQFLKLNAAPLFDITLDIDAQNKSRYAIVIALPRPTTLTPSLLRSPNEDKYHVLFDFGLSSQSMGEDGDFKIDDDTSSIRNIAKNSTISQSTVDRKSLYRMITENLHVKKIEQLKKLMEKVGQVLGLKDKEISEDAQMMINIASNLEQLKPSQRNRKFWKQRNMIYNAFTIDKLQTEFNAIDWKVLLSGLMGGKHSKSSHVDFSDATIYVPYPDYLRRLFRLVQYTNKRMLHNTILVSYIRDMLKDLIPKKKSEPRWKFCIKCTKSVFSLELSSLYMRSFSPVYLSTLQAEVQEIFDNVKTSLLSQLNESSWDETHPRRKEDALRKIRSLKGNFIGPSLEKFEDGAIKAIYIDPANFFYNVKLVYQTFRQHLFSLYSEKVDEDKTTWTFVTFPITVNAYYIQQFNSIVVPLGFLNPPHYTTAAPKYINYATLALTIAHEALHALDGSGSDFDEHGRFHQGFQHVSHGSYLQKKSVCVAKQYSSHFKKVIPFQQAHVPIQVDGNLTQNENLADIAGLQIAFKAYLKFRETSSLSKRTWESERKIPGLKYTLEQIYFLTVAQAYCANVSPLGYVFLLEVDEHTPHPERINGMLMNIPEFAVAYNCPVGSSMNPKVKCSLW